MIIMTESYIATLISTPFDNYRVYDSVSFHLFILCSWLFELILLKLYISYQHECWILDENLSCSEISFYKFLMEIYTINMCYQNKITVAFKESSRFFIKVGYISLIYPLLAKFPISS